MRWEFNKIRRFRRKYQESLKIAEYPLHQLIRLGRLARDPYRSCKSQHMSESSLRVILLPSLVYPYLELDIEQDGIRKPWLNKQETE